MEFVAGFVSGAPLPLRHHGDQALESTSRRPRSGICVTASRSLDSYRQGRRGNRAREEEYERVYFGDDKRKQPQSRGASSDGDQKPRPPKTKIGLLKALIRAKVASNETSELLLRSGFISVNGIVKQDPTLRVDLVADVITVKGKDLVFDVGEDASTTHINDWDDSVEDEATLTRAQRDFRKGKFAQEGRAAKAKKYSRDIDGGFYSGKRFSAGK